MKTIMSGPLCEINKCSIPISKFSSISSLIWENETFFDLYRLEAGFQIVDYSTLSDRLARLKPRLCAYFENSDISQAKSYDGFAQIKLENIPKLKLGLVERILAQLECLKAILSVQISKNLNNVYSIEVHTEHYKHSLKVWEHQPLEWFESRIRISHAFYLWRWTRKIFRNPSRICTRHGIEGPFDWIALISN